MYIHCNSCNKEFNDLSEGVRYSSINDSIIQKDVIIIKSPPYLLYERKKGHCKNCGDQIGDDSNSGEFCSDQLEHK